MSFGSGCVHQRPVFIRCQVHTQQNLPDWAPLQIIPQRRGSLGMMIACTITTIYDPVRMSEAYSILMAQYLALSGLVGAYFARGGKN